MQFRHTLLSCVRVSKMQGAEFENEGSVLKYMTKSEIEEQRCSMLIMTQRFSFCAHLRCCPRHIQNNTSNSAYKLTYTAHKQTNYFSYL